MLGNRLWCNIYLDESMLVHGFELVPKLIGRGGCNTKTIFQKTGSHILVCGHKSGRQRGRQWSGRVASEAPLMIVIEHGKSVPNFRTSFTMTMELVKRVMKTFEQWCHQRHIPLSPGPRFWIGKASKGSLESLGSLLDGIEVALTAVDPPAATATSRRNHHGSALAAVKESGEALENVGPALQADREVVLAAVSRDGLALEHAAPSLQADREIVLAAVAQNRDAARFISPTVRAQDKELWGRVQAALSQ